MQSVFDLLDTPQQGGSSWDQLVTGLGFDSQAIAQQAPIFRQNMIEAEATPEFHTQAGEQFLRQHALDSTTRDFTGGNWQSLGLGNVRPSEGYAFETESPRVSPSRYYNTDADWPRVRDELSQWYPNADMATLQRRYAEMRHESFNREYLNRWIGHYQQEGLDFQEGTARYWAERMPFVGGAAAATRASEIADSASRISAGDATQHDYQRLAQGIVYAQQEGNQGFLENLWHNIVTRAPGFVAEFIATGGITAPVGAGARNVATRVIGQQAAESIAGRAVVGITGALAQSEAQNLLLPGGAARHASQRVLQDTFANNNQVPEGADIVSNLPAGHADQFIELLSERSGASIPFLGRALREIPAVEALVQGVAARWVNSAAGRTIGQFRELLATPGWAQGAARWITRESGYSGLPGEVFEERLGEVLRGATGLEPNYGTTGDLFAGRWGQAFEQLAAEGIAFSLIGSGQNLLARGAAMTAGQQQAQQPTPQQLAPNVPLGTQVSDQTQPVAPQQLTPETPIQTPQVVDQTPQVQPQQQVDDPYPNVIVPPPGFFEPGNPVTWSPAAPAAPQTQVAQTPLAPVSAIPGASGAVESGQVGAQQPEITPLAPPAAAQTTVAPTLTMELVQGSSLTQRQKDVLVARFGLDGNGTRTLEATGEQLKITRERVRQIESAALKKLGIAESAATTHTKERAAAPRVAPEVASLGTVDESGKRLPPNRPMNIEAENAVHDNIVDDFVQNQGRPSQDHISAIMGFINRHADPVAAIKEHYPDLAEGFGEEGLAAYIQKVREYNNETNKRTAASAGQGTRKPDASAEAVASGNAPDARPSPQANAGAAQQEARPEQLTAEQRLAALSERMEELEPAELEMSLDSRGQPAEPPRGIAPPWADSTEMYLVTHRKTNEEHWFPTKAQAKAYVKEHGGFINPAEPTYWKVEYKVKDEDGKAEASSSVYLSRTAADRAAAEMEADSATLPAEERAFGIRVVGPPAGWTPQGWEASLDSSGPSPAAGTSAAAAPSAARLIASIDSFFNVVNNNVRKIEDRPGAHATARLEQQVVETLKLHALNPETRLEEAIHIAANRLGDARRNDLQPSNLPNDVAEGFREFYDPTQPLSWRLMQEGLAQWAILRAKDALHGLTPQQQEADLWATKWFTDNGLLRPLDAITPAFRAWSRLDPAKRTEATISKTGRPAIPLEGKQAPETAQSLLNRLDEQVTNNLEVVGRMEAYAVRKGMTPSQEGERAMETAAVLRYQGRNWAEQWMKTGFPTIGADGGFEPGAMGADAVWSRIQADEQLAYTAYAKSKQTVSDWKTYQRERRAWDMDAALRKAKGPKGKPRSTVTRDEYKAALKSLKKMQENAEQYERFEATNRDRVAFLNRGLRFLAQLPNGLDPVWVEETIRLHPDYLSSERVFDERTTEFLEQDRKSRRPGKMAPSFTKKKTGGTGEETKLALTTFVERISDVAALATKYATDERYYHLMTQPGMGPWARRMRQEEADDSTKPIWQTRRHGQRVRFWINDAAFWNLLTNRQGEGEGILQLANGAANIGPEILGAPISQLPAKGVRTGAVTLSPVFQTFEVLFRSWRDFLTRTRRMRSVPELFAWWPQWVNFIATGALAKGTHAKAYIELYERMAGASGRLDVEGQDPAVVYRGYPKWAQELMRRLGYGEMVPRALEIKNVLREMGVTKQTVEEWNRTGYMPPLPVQVKLLHAAAEVHNSYLYQGYVTKQASKTVPFLGSQVANISKYFRNYRDNPKGAIAGGLMSLILLRTLYWLMYKDEDDYRERHLYGRNDWYIKTPLGWVRGPGPQGLEVPIGALIDESLRAFSDSNPEFVRILSTLFDTFTPNRMEPLNTIGQIVGNRQGFMGLMGPPLIPREDRGDGVIANAAQHQIPRASENLTGGMVSVNNPVLRLVFGRPRPHLSVTRFFEELERLEAQHGQPGEDVELYNEMVGARSLMYRATRLMREANNPQLIDQLDEFRIGFALAVTGQSPLSTGNPFQRIDSLPPDLRSEVDNWLSNRITEAARGPAERSSGMTLARWQELNAERERRRLRSQALLRSTGMTPLQLYQSFRRDNPQNRDMNANRIQEALTRQPR